MAFGRRFEIRGVRRRSRLCVRRSGALDDGTDIPSASAVDDVEERKALKVIGLLYGDAPGVWTVGIEAWGDAGPSRVSSESLR